MSDRIARRLIRRGSVVSIACSVCLVLSGQVSCAAQSEPAGGPIGAPTRPADGPPPRWGNAAGPDLRSVRDGRAGEAPPDRPAPPATNGDAQRPPILLISALTGWYRPRIDPVDYDEYLHTLIDRAGLPIAERAEIFYDHVIGRYPRYVPRNGGWEPRHGGIPQRVDRDAHLARIEGPLRRRGVDEQYDGWIILDFEGTHPLMEHSNPASQKAAIRYTKSKNRHVDDPERIRYLAARQWEAAYRDMMERTIAEIRRLSPDARITMWGWPRPIRYSDEEWRRQQWLAELLDGFSPILYPRRKIVEADPHQRFERTEQAQREGFERQLESFKPLAAAYDKPIIPITAFSFNRATQRRYPGLIEAEKDILTPYEEAFEEMGIDTFFLWHNVRDAEEAEAFVEYLRDTYVPTLRSRFRLLETDPSPGTPSGAQGTAPDRESHRPRVRSVRPPPAPR